MARGEHQTCDLSVSNQLFTAAACQQLWNRTRGNNYHCLDHVDSIGPHLRNTSIHVNLALGCRLVEQIIHGDERARASNSGTAVYDRRTRQTIVTTVELPVKCQQWRWVQRDAVIGPRRKVKLSNCQRRSSLQHKWIHHHDLLLFTTTSIIYNSA